jgi:hypothetical protein
MADSAAYIDFDEGAAPGTPAAGKVRVYAKTDGLPYSKDDAGSETGMAGGGGDVATDTIWDAKGDLAVGTGSNTSAKLTAGANGAFLQTLSSEPTGLIYRTAPVAASVQLTAGNYTGTTGSFAIITGATLSLTTLARRVRIHVIGAAQVGTAADAVVFDVSIDGTYVSGGATNGLTGIREQTTGHRKDFSFTVLSPVLTAAAHTSELHAKRAAGSGTITILASSADTVLTFQAEETFLLT